MTKQIETSLKDMSSFFSILAVKVLNPSGHAPLCHLQLWLIMEEIGEEGTGQGQSHEKRDRNRHSPHSHNIWTQKVCEMSTGQ